MVVVRDTLGRFIAEKILSNVVLNISYSNAIYHPTDELSFPGYTQYFPIAITSCVTLPAGLRQGMEWRVSPCQGLTVTPQLLLIPLTPLWISLILNTMKYTALKYQHLFQTNLGSLASS